MTKYIRFSNNTSVSSVWNLANKNVADGLEADDSALKFDMRP